MCRTGCDMFLLVLFKSDIPFPRITFDFIPYFPLSPSGRSGTGQTLPLYKFCLPCLPPPGDRSDVPFSSLLSVVSWTWSFGS